MAVVTRHEFQGVCDWGSCAIRMLIGEGPDFWAALIAGHGPVQSVVTETEADALALLDTLPVTWLVTT